MSDVNLDISSKPVRDFLDSADIVLNSNTFILEFEIAADNIEESLLTFLNTEDLIIQLLHQDKYRGWNNLRYFDEHDESFKVRSGKILTDEIKLKISEPVVDKREYLIAMLTGDTSKGRFHSYYSNEKGRKEAEVIIDRLTSFLSVDGTWDLFIAEPDFLKNEVDDDPGEPNLRYFEGDDGNDTATILRCKERGFLILTNGIP